MSNQKYEFKNEQTRAVIAYAREHFGDEPEFLWINIPDAAVLRCPETGQWYALIMTVKKSDLDDLADETTETIDLICDPDEIETIADEKKIFRGLRAEKGVLLTRSGAQAEKNLNKIKKTANYY